LEFLSQAIAAGSTSVIDHQDFAQLLAAAGRSAEAVSVLEKATKLFPFTPMLYKLMSLQLIQQKDYAKALQTMRRHLDLFPEDAFMRNLIKQAEAAPAPR
jgi:TolA-binding protein